ncbi:hypothetical protein, partial [Escherichia coli]|uniref:hypothetical protein n=1 Tax=Escherichia coli TaxID=562 RepID=UPI003C6C043F
NTPATTRQYPTILFDPLLMSGKATKILPTIAPIRNNIKYCGELILTEQIRTDNTNINTDSSEKIIDALPAEIK